MAIKIRDFSQETITHLFCQFDLVEWGQNAMFKHVDAWGTKKKMQEMTTEYTLILNPNAFHHNFIPTPLLKPTTIFSDML